MHPSSEHTLAASWIAFSESTRIAAGDPLHVIDQVLSFHASHPQGTILVFDAETSQTIEVDLRKGAQALPQVSAPSGSVVTETESRKPGPGRPKLGVVAREVTLLPRHWEWLATQPGGASVALRKLVEQARRANQDIDRKRERQDAAYKFMNVMAGDAPGYEEALRALFAGDMERLRSQVAAWPADVREHTLALAAPACVEAGRAGVP